MGKSISGELRLLNRKFSVLLENFDSGVLVENDQGKIAFVNKKFCDIFSISLEPKDLIGFDCNRAAEESSILFKNPKEFLNTTQIILTTRLPMHAERLEMSNGKIIERDYIPIIENDVLKAQIWFYRDFSRFALIENSLKYRLNFEALITDLSYSFITAQTDNLVNTIENALGDIGRFTGTDRSYIFRFSFDLENMWNTHEWCEEGIKPEKNNMQNIPAIIFPWLMEKLKRFENIVINSTLDMPEEAAEEKKLLESQGIKSLVVVPLVYGYELLGFLGFDSVREYRQWDYDSVKLLRVFGSILSGAIIGKQKEEALIVSEKRYKSVVDNVTEVIFQTDKEGCWTFLNPAWETITGFTIEESLGKQFLNYVHPDDRQRNYELFIPLINREKSYCRQIIRYLTKDGSFCWIEVFAKLILDEKDEIAGTSGTLNDITTKKIQEDEIRKLSKAVETTPTAVVLAELNGKIFFVNKGLLKFGGYKSESDIIGKTIFDFTDDKGKETLADEVLVTLGHGNDWAGEINVITSNGALLPVRMICTIIKDELGAPQYLLANFFDISEMKRAEVEIKNALMKEKELNEMKSRFVSLVSHEFRTPLAAILSSTEILEYYSGKLNAEKKNLHYQRIKSSINNLLDILNETSEINRIDSGRLSLNLQEIEIASIVKDILDEIKLGNNNKPEILLKVIPENLRITSDKKLFRQITLNLISNAVKFTPIEKKIYISFNEAGDNIILEVKDEGLGIPLSEQGKIFEPFTRSINVQSIKGTGLGLSITKKAVESLKGTIDFVSIENTGTTFTVRIPKNGTWERI